jgi:hypothetical protein
MYDARKIVPGLIVFVLVIGLPFWWNLARGAEPRVPEIEKPAGEDSCVLEAAEMRTEHMQLLVSWRDDAVRSGDRVHVTEDGRRFRKSLTGACLQCHTDKGASCDRCHDYLNVHPVCWDCHVETGRGR